MGERDNRYNYNVRVQRIGHTAIEKGNVMEILQVVSPNFSTGRKGRTPIAIVNHIAAGSFPGCLTWLCNAQAQASAHFLITRQGVIYQLVQDEDAAWHCGIVNEPDWSLYDGTNPNRYTIGIEHEGFPDEPLTEPQYQATLWLHRQLIAKWGIPIDTDHIIGHYRIDSVNRPNCPGPSFPWTRLFNDLKGVVEVPEWMQKIMDRSVAAGLIESEKHSPTENATKWFCLGIALKVLQIMGRDV